MVGRLKQIDGVLQIVEIVRPTSLENLEHLFWKIKDNQLLNTGMIADELEHCIRQYKEELL